MNKLLKYSHRTLLMTAVLVSLFFFLNVLFDHTNIQKNLKVELVRVKNVKIIKEGSYFKIITTQNINYYLTYTFNLIENKDVGGVQDSLVYISYYKKNSIVSIKSAYNGHIIVKGELKQDDNRKVLVLNIAISIGLIGFLVYLIWRFGIANKLSISEKLE